MSALSDPIIEAAVEEAVVDLLLDPGLNTNSARVIGDVTFSGAEAVAFHNLEDGVIAGEGSRVTLQSSAGATLTNDGAISARVQFGGGDDIVENDSLIIGTIRTGAGNDTVTNTNFIDGAVQLADGNDFFANEGVVTGSVNLGNGNDTYTAAFNGNFSNPDISAAKVQGGQGNDRLFGAGADDILNGGRGQDDLRGHDGNDKLYGGQGADHMLGGNGNDLLIGGIGADRMIGGKDNDVLRAGSGKDMLIGGSGDDELTGGSGADVFKFEGRSGNDTITDFRDADTVLIDLSGILPQPIEEIEVELAAAAPLAIDVFDYLSDSGAGAVLDLGALYASLGYDVNENSITFENVLVEDLSAEQFMF